LLRIEADDVDVQSVQNAARLGHAVAANGVGRRRLRYGRTGAREIGWAKFAALAEGAAIATKTLGGGS
jgi:hypothetical protein